MKKTFIALVFSLGLVGVIGFSMSTILASTAIAQEKKADAAPVAPVVAAPVVAAPAPAPAAAVAPVADPALVAECDISCVMMNLQKVFSDWKTLGWQAGLMALLVLLIGTFKNSLLRKWLWDWAGPAKALIPYVLSLIVALLAIPFDSWSLATIIMALTTGGGAVAIHQLLVALKDTKWIGEKFAWILDVIAKFLKKPTT